jgi:hypothetical protein
MEDKQLTSSHVVSISAAGTGGSQVWGAPHSCSSVPTHLALAGGEWSASCPGRFTPGTPWIGGWVNPRAGLDDVEKRKFLTELRPIDHPARSQSLSRLSVLCLYIQPVASRYPGSLSCVSISTPNTKMNIIFPIYLFLRN